MNNYLNIKIYSNNSLSTKGFYILMTSIILPALFIGTAFSLIGAWPVLGFMGLEIILIYIFFKILFYKNNFYEHIMLDKAKFSISYNNKNNVINSVNLEPTWLQVKLENNNNKLQIFTHGNAIELGKCLAIKEKASLAKVIQEALLNWKQEKIFN